MQIVAPAGSFAALKAAVANGADAVYLGMSQFGARAKAENFADTTLRPAIEYAHVFGTKVFVTLNTLIKDGEMHFALDAARLAYDCGADAAIVQDLRFIEKLKHALPDFVLHASTQMGIHNALGARTLAGLGIKRAVLARETLPEDIAEIKSEGVEIEFFVQGALCVCFSGNCYFSSLASSYSGNRGKCMQLCRKPYKLDGKNGYFLSAKDICLYDKLDLLEKLGVDAIKIEGRMRSPAYVAQAVRIYKSSMPTSEAVDGLKSVFNRGNYCCAYLDADAPFRVIYDKSQSNIGRFVGKIDGIKGNFVHVRGFVPHINDGYKITRNGEEIGGAEVREGKIAVNCKCSVGDELNITADGALAERLALNTRLLSVGVYVNICANSTATVEATCNGSTVTVVGDFTPQQAVSRALSQDDIVRAFEKVAEYPFAPEITVFTDGNSFMPVSALNELRRKAYDAMFARLVDGYSIKRGNIPYVGLNYNEFDGRGVILAVEDIDILDDEILSKIDYVALNPRDYGSVPKLRPAIDKPILLSLPITMRGADKKVLAEAVGAEFIAGVISNNLYSLELTDKPILLGYGHNIIGDCEYSHIRSFEADELSKSDNAWTYAFGYAPVMTLCHCPYGKCKNCSGDDVLIDERGRKFRMRRYNAAHCYWRLLNCIPHKLYDTARTRNLYYDCTGLSAREILAVLDGEYTGKYTRGNINRGLK